jgi:hypothetical protein
VIQVEQATTSFFARSMYDKGRTIQAIPSLQIPDVSVEEINAALQEIDAEELASPIQANFKEICLDLAPPGGDSANAHYRLMSAYSHPSEFLLGQYINFGDAEGASVSDAVGVRDEPNYPPLWS